MQALYLVPSYFLWHYTTAFRDLLHVYSNIVWFVYHFFSIPVLLRTLFSPWKRLEEHVKGHPLENLIVNAAMRLVGFIARLSTIVAGLAALILSIPLGVILFAVWFLAPLLIPTLFIFGVISFTV